jgi:hypothetical protein
MYCCPSTFSLTSQTLPLPRVNEQYTVYDSVWLWGLGVLSCVEDHILHSVSDQIQNQQNCYTTPNKND